jgi:cob(I)alamin adenosyltransferase
MKIYTRKGDGGETGIWGGRRLGKDDPRVAAMGSVDECNAAIGVALAEGVPPAVAERLGRVQRTLFVVGCELMAPETTGSGASVPRLSPEEVTRIEELIDGYQAELPQLRNFLLPGGTRAGAHLHLARAVCRRAERQLTALARRQPVAAAVPAYLNRLSDLLFVLARYVNHAGGAGDAEWHA